MLKIDDLKYKPDNNFEFNVFLFSTSYKTSLVFKTKLNVFDYFLFEYDRKMREHFKTNLSPPLTIDGLSIVLPLDDDEMQILKLLRSKDLDIRAFDFDDGTPEIPGQFKSTDSC